MSSFIEIGIDCMFGLAYRKSRLNNAGIRKIFSL